jgi:LmbE family N-acetylglucosaminyl deacetylase
MRLLVCSAHTADVNGAAEWVAQLAEEIRAFRPDAVLAHHGPDPRSMDRDTAARLVGRAAPRADIPGL